MRRFAARPAALIGVAVALLGLVAAAVLLPGMLAGQSALPSFAAGLPGTGGPPSSTEQFLRGNRDYDADLVWRSFSEELRGRLLGRGESLEQLQQQLQAARARGTKVVESSYIGGKELPNGSSIQFYLVTYRPSAQADPEYVPYVFTLDRGGKIAKVQ